MGPAQFVFWLRGVMQAEPELTPERLKVIRSVLEDVIVSPPPSAQARIQGVQDAWRTDLRRKLEEERKEFLKSLPPHRPWSVIPTAGCEL